MNNALGFTDDGRDDGLHAPRECARAGDLMTYLYGEASAEEGHHFTRHLDTCAACRDELAAFGGVRVEVAAWRDEVLSAAPGVDLSGALAQAAAPTLAAPAHARSARAALREFFALSPVWLRAGTVAAAVAVCALAALVFARTELGWNEDGVILRAGVPAKTTVERVEVPAAGALSEQQAEEMARRRVEDALAAQRAEFALVLERAVVNARGNSQSSSSSSRPAPVMVSGVRQPPRVRAVAKKLTDSRNLEDVRGEDEGLPGLYDLLREAN